MTDRGHALSVPKQAAVVGIARSTVYYLPRPCRGAISRSCVGSRTAIGAPFAGSRMLRRLLGPEGRKVVGRHAKTLMQRMGVEAL